ncbi:MAG: Na/Pi cotransporter family protein [Magnetococcales bacterium]|nr:Na/Pi cotransporter family protein [Magnetococcales bacterium]
MSGSWPLIAQGISGFALYFYGIEKSLYALGNLQAEPLRKRLGALVCQDLCGWLEGGRAGLLLMSNRALLELLGALAAGNLLVCRQTMLLLLGGLIGTTTLAVLLVLTPTTFAALPLVLGAGTLSLSTRPNGRYLGHLLLGIGLLLLGLSLLEGALLNAPGLVALLGSPWIGLPAALLVAALLNSAHAVVGLLAALVAFQQLPFSVALAAVLAANLGAALPVFHRVRAASAQLKRLFLAHLLFQGAGLLVVGWWVESLAGLLAGWPVDRAWQLVIFHVGYNLLIVLIGLPLLRPLVDLANRLLPDPYGTETESLEFNERYWPRYLDEDLLETPTLALAMARREVGLIAALIEEMLELVPEALFSEDPQTIIRLRKMDDRVDEIHRAVTRYLAGIGGATLPPQAAVELMAAMTVANELEAIGDIIENNLGHIAEMRLVQRADLSEEMRSALTAYHRLLCSTFRQSADSFVTDDPALAREVMAQKEAISALDAQGRLQQMRALRSGEGDFTGYSLQMDLYENFKRIFYHAKRIAKVVAGV